jgi:pimeloyl-ACP methyl ester carboxylesterase
MIKKFLKILGLLLLVVVLGILIRYAFWRTDRLETLAAQSHIVDTASGPVQYSLQGEEGQIILFLHGTPGGFDHNPFFTPENLPGFRQLTPSRPGYLGTPLATGETPEQQARAYAALLDVLGIDRVVVLGASGGGPSAVHFAALYPERTLALIGLEILTYPRTEALRMPGMMRSDFLYWLGVSAITGIDGGKTMLSMFQLPETDVARVLKSPNGLDRTKAMVWAGWPAAARVAGWENDSAQFMKLALPLEQVTAPALILHGTEDIQVSHDRAREMAARLPNGHFHSVAGATHAMPLTHRDELQAVIRAFLAELPERESEIDGVQ